MNKNMLNARGKLVCVRDVTRENLLATADRIAEHTKNLPYLDGVWICGSTVSSEPDCLSDLDLRFFADNPEKATKEIVDVLMSAGAIYDGDAESVHFPMDYPAVLLDDIYVEFTVSMIDDRRREIERILENGRLDDGQVHSARVARILFDNTGRVTELQEFCRQCEYPKGFLKWISSVGLDVEMKIIRQAVMREDWHQAMEWLARLCMCSCRILLARNERFFPGHKRLLTKTIPELPEKPDGFVEFWQTTLSGKIEDWNATLEQAQEFTNTLKKHGDTDYWSKQRCE